MRTDEKDNETIEEQLQELNRKFLRQHSLVVTMQRTLDKDERTPEEIVGELKRLRKRGQDIQKAIRHLQEQL